MGQHRAERIRRLLSHRRVAVLLAVLAVVIMLPGLDEGLMLDDLNHRVKLVDREQLPERFKAIGHLGPDSGSLKAALRDMHGYVRNEEDLRTCLAYGLFPWWTNPDFRGANFRPLDSFSHWLDYRLYPDRPWLMHAHSLVWFAGVVFLLVVLYRRLCLPVAVGAVAGFLFVIDDNNYFPVMWVANRNLVHALFFGVLSILTYSHWRRNGSGAAGAASPVFLLLSLLSTEAGIATMAYLVSYELFLDRGGWKKKIVSLLPAAAVIVVWRVVYNYLEFGATGGGFIIDPVREPGAFLQAMLVRGPLLLFGLWGMLPAESYGMAGVSAKIAHLIFAVGLLVVFAGALAPLWRQDRVARFWGAGMLFCIVPICATVPMNRNLLFAAIGACGLLGMYVYGVFAGASWAAGSRRKRYFLWVVCGVLILIHVPGAVAGRIMSGRMLPRVFNQFYATVEPPADTSFEDKTLVVVNAPHPIMFGIMPALNAWRGGPLPKKIRLLSPGFGPMRIERVETNVLMISAEKENLFAVQLAREPYLPHLVYMYAQFNSVVRSEDLGFAVGETITMDPMTVEVLETDEGGQPSRIKIRFAIPLERPDLLWLQWHWGPRGSGRYSIFELPAVGEGVTLAGPV